MLYDLKEVTKFWWLVVLKGLLMMILGVFAIVMPAKTLETVTLVFGIILIVDGVLTALLGLFSIKGSEKWWVMILQGGLAFLLGLAIFNYPQMTIAVLFFIVALWALVGGLLTIVMSFITRKETYSTWMLATAGVVSVIVSIVMLYYPMQSVKLLIILGGITAVITGLMQMAFGMDLWSLHRDVKKLTKAEESTTTA